MTISMNMIANSDRTQIYFGDKVYKPGELDDLLGLNDKNFTKALEESTKRISIENSKSKLDKVTDFILKGGSKKDKSKTTKPKKVKEKKSGGGSTLFKGGGSRSSGGGSSVTSQPNRPRNTNNSNSSGGSVAGKKIEDGISDFGKKMGDALTNMFTFGESNEKSWWDSGEDIANLFKDKDDGKKPWWKAYVQEEQKEPNRVIQIIDKGKQNFNPESGIRFDHVISGNEAVLYPEPPKKLQEVIEHIVEKFNPKKAIKKGINIRK